MAKLLERMFGSRSVSADAAVLIVDEVRAAATTALRETATASGIRVGSDPGDEALHAACQRCAEMAANLVATADGLPGIAEPFRVVLMGRTQAGKSTLSNYLTGGQHSVVGSGGQRTTRDAISAPLAGRPDILIVDTPGVGALDGAEDRELALTEARTADLVIWVGADGALQEETAVALEQAADWGVPLVLFGTAGRSSTLRGVLPTFSSIQRTPSSHSTAMRAAPASSSTASGSGPERPSLSTPAQLWPAFPAIQRRAPFCTRVGPNNSSPSSRPKRTGGCTIGL